MCREHHHCSIWPPHTEHTCVFFFCKRFQSPPTFPPGLCSAQQEDCTLGPQGLGVSVELREAGEQGCEGGGTVWACSEKRRPCVCSPLGLVTSGLLASSLGRSLSNTFLHLWAQHQAPGLRVRLWVKASCWKEMCFTDNLAWILA